MGKMMMSEKVDKATLWTARCVFFLMTLVATWLIYRCGWSVFHYWPSSGLCMVGYLGAACVSFTGKKPDLVPAVAKADKEAFQRIRLMLTIFSLSALGIGIWVWLVFRH